MLPAHKAKLLTDLAQKNKIKKQYKGVREVINKAIRNGDCYCEYYCSNLDAEVIEHLKIIGYDVTKTYYSTNDYIKISWKKIDN